MIHLAKDLGKFWSRTEWIGLVHLEEALGKKVISRSGNDQRKIYFFKSKNFIMSQGKLTF